MSSRKLPHPSSAEMAILGVLWRRGPSTVREVHAEVGPARSVGYTTILKFMQLMHEKGLLHRDESERSHVYSAAVSQEKTQRQLVKELLDRVFGGSAQKLIQHTLSAKKSSPQELQQIRQLLDELERSGP
jgi:predicted transcriptional regulator